MEVNNTTLEGTDWIDMHTSHNKPDPQERWSMNERTDGQADRERNISDGNIRQETTSWGVFVIVIANLLAYKSWSAIVINDLAGTINKH